MTLEIRRGKLPSELIGVVQAEYKEEIGTAVIYVSNLVDVSVLEPYTNQVGCDNPQHGVKTKRYFRANDVTRCGPNNANFPPCLQGTLIGPDGSADFVLYY